MALRRIKRHVFLVNSLLGLPVRSSHQLITLDNLYLFVPVFVHGSD